MDLREVSWKVLDCQHGLGPSVSLKAGNFLTSELLSASIERLCCMKFVSNDVSALTHFDTKSFERPASSSKAIKQYQ